MKTWEKILLYPVGLYMRLTDGSKRRSKKWRPVAAVIMVAVLLCGMLPLTVAASSAAQVKVSGVELSATGYYSMAPGTVGTKLDSAPAVGATGYVHWDQSESVLTLYGVTVDGGNNSSGIYANGDFKIVLAENTTNSVTSGYTNAITCDRGSVTIGGSGTLLATGATNGIKATYSVNLFENANITVIGNNGCGIVNNPTVFSNNADPVRIAATATVSITGSTYGICVNDGYGASPIIDSPNVEITGGTAAFSEFPHGAPRLGDEIIALAGSSVSDAGAYDSATYSTYKYVKTAVKPYYTVSFNANGGTGSMADATDVYGDYTLPANGFTAPSDKAFKAWLVGSEEKNPGETVTVTADTTVKAVWQDVVKYDLWVGGVQVTSINASNITGSAISGTVSYDAATKTLTLNNATVGAYEFGTFWHDTSCIYSEEELTVNLVGNNTLTGSDLGGSSYCIYLDEGDLVFTGNGSLTATSADLSADKWTVPVFADGTITVEDSCTITACCGESGWVARAFYSYASGTRYFLPNAAGILVAGNQNAADASELQICNGNPDAFKYLRIAPGYLVTLNTNGGTVTSGNLVCYFADTGATLPTTVTKSGYVFDGWYDNNAFTGTAIVEIPANATGNKEYWAKWTPATYTVSFAAGGGIGTMEDVPVVSGNYTLPANGFTAPDGKRFKAWSVDGNEKAAGDTITITADITVTAIWEDIPVAALTGTVTITGDAKFGSELTATVTGSNNTGTLSYQWVRDTTNITGATGQTYTPVETDLNSKLSVIVTSSVETGSIVSEKTAFVEKADNNEVPTGLTGVAPTTEGGYDGKIMGTTGAMEYSDNSGFSWAQNCEDLETRAWDPGTYYVRYRETSTHKAGTNYATVVVPDYEASLAPTYTVSFAADEGTGAMADVTGISGEYTLPANGFTAPEGKRFKAWSVDGEEMAAGDKITVTADTTVTAVWEGIPSDNPPTGDSSLMLLWAVLLTSGLCLAATAVFGKKRFFAK